MIYGERLRLRAFEKEDLPRFVAWLNDPQVRRYLLTNLPISMAQEERWFSAEQNRPAVEQVLVIEVRQPSADDHPTWVPIGNTQLMEINWVNRSAEVGLMIGEKRYWNQGFGREVMQVMLRHAFETLNLNRVYLRVFDDNLGGVKAYEHAGFQHEGRQRQAEYKEGRYTDVLMMSVLREEWQG